MDSLLCQFSPIPSRIILYYATSLDISNFCSKIEGHISIATREIIDLRNTDSERIKTLRQKISSFNGLKDLVMDQAIIETEKPE